MDLVLVIIIILSLWQNTTTKATHNRKHSIEGGGVLQFHMVHSPGPLRWGAWKQADMVMKL